MKIRTVAVAAVALFLPLAASGCGTNPSEPRAPDDRSEEGDGDVGSMSVDELSEALQKRAGLSAAQADCIAEALDANDLGLEDFSESGNPGDTSDPRVKAYIRDSISCFTATTGG